MIVQSIDFSFFSDSQVCAAPAQTPISAHLGTQRRGFGLGVYPGAQWSQHFFVAVFLLSTTFGIAHSGIWKKKKHWSKQTEEIRNAAPELLLITSKLFLQDWFWGLRELRYPGAVCFQQSSTKLFFPLGNQSPHHGVPKCLLGMFYLRSRPCHPIFVKLSVYLGSARPLSS